MIKLKMLKTATGSEDGFTVRVFEAGEEYEIAGLLASYFLRKRVAVRVGEPTDMGALVKELAGVVRVA